jgi:hypothetical protein
MFVLGTPRDLKVLSNEAKLQTVLFDKCWYLKAAFCSFYNLVTKTFKLQGSERNTGQRREGDGGTKCIKEGFKE